MALGEETRTLRKVENFGLVVRPRWHTVAETLEVWQSAALGSALILSDHLAWLDLEAAKCAGVQETVRNSWNVPLLVLELLG